MAPPVVVYVLAAVAGVAAVYAFKEFVYEPHIAPTFEAWAEDFLERRRAARSRRASAVPVRTSRRTPSDSSSPPTHDGDHRRDRSESGGVHGPNDFLLDGLELEALASKEVDEWRNEVLRSQKRTRDNLRRRRTNRLADDFNSFNSTTTTTLDESFTSLTHTPLASTHVISNVSSPVTASTVSLPQTPARRLQSVSQSPTTEGNGDPLFIAPLSPPSPIREIPGTSPRAAPPNPTGHPPHPLTDNAIPLPIPIPDRCSPGTDSAPYPLPFTPTYQVMVDDSPFGPLLPDTPRSSAEMYGERPFSPISRVMGSPSGTVSPRTTLSSSVNSTSSIQTLRSSGVLRKPSALANEVAMSGTDDASDEGHSHSSPSTLNPGPGTNGSIISSLSERYPAPPTPPVIVSPPVSSIGIISAPSTPRSDSPEVVMHSDAVATEPHPLSSPVSQTRPSLPVLQLPPESSSLHLISQSRSPAQSAMSPALSYASFLSLMPVSRAVSESEGDDFLSIASDDSDWSASPMTPSRGRGHKQGPVADRANNPFLDFEHVAHDTSPVGSSGSERGSQGSEVLVSDIGPEGTSEVGSDESWGSAKKH